MEAPGINQTVKPAGNRGGQVASSDHIRAAPSDGLKLSEIDEWIVAQKIRATHRVQITSPDCALQRTDCIFDSAADGRLKGARPDDIGAAAADESGGGVALNEIGRA